ncbi:hypothetical protein VB776_16170 [Arcicella sp. DC2W]|uniref:Uncharacterized protein n=1 Tax=Arcicella gelida TaxID=2984195 RepID=A0ABU5S7T6_9BACT|nr:hypothetical protein [Arcicella sp. DC2W]MEA5404469.1 hypothetical protein [Arcicella sp. DC2W]
MQIPFFNKIFEKQPESIPIKDLSKNQVVNKIIEISKKHNGFANAWLSKDNLLLDELMLRFDELADQNTFFPF